MSRWLPALVGVLALAGVAALMVGRQPMGLLAGLFLVAVVVSSGPETERKEHL